MKLKIKKGDKVRVMSGKDRGKEAVVDKIVNGDRIVLPGINAYKRHQKPRSDKNPGEIKELFRPVPQSTVQLVCPSCHQPSRVGRRIINEKKERFCKKCGSKID